MGLCCPPVIDGQEGRETDQGTDRRRVLIVIGALMLAMLLAALDQTIVSTALPTIVGDLGGLEHISWVVTSYLLAVTIVTPLYGKLGDLYGRKVVLQGALVLFLIGSAARRSVRQKRISAQVAIAAKPNVCGEIQS